MRHLAAIAAVNRTARMRDRIASDKKWCGDCAAWLHVADFPFNRRMPDGRATYCRKHTAARQHAYRQRVRQAEAGRLAEAEQLARREQALAKIVSQMIGPGDERRAALLEEARRIPHTWVLRCCSGQLINDEASNWWRAEHRPGCDSSWQPTPSYWTWPELRAAE
jgi:hypothetical protein